MKQITKYIDLLKSPNWRVQREGCKQLGETNNPQCIPFLQEKFNDANWHVRLAACEALSKFQLDDDVEIFIKHQDDPNWHIRRIICEIVGKTDGHQHIDLFHKYLEDSSWYVRRMACKTLRKLRNTKSFASIIKLLKDKNRNVRTAAFSALKILESDEAFKTLNFHTIEFLIKKSKKFDEDASARAEIWLEQLMPFHETSLENLDSLYCTSCFRWFKKHTIRVKFFWKTNLAGCRLCNKIESGVTVQQVTAVLDGDMDKKFIKTNGNIRINWLTDLKLFDFDHVEIISATDKDVEQFCIQVGNDTDEIRQPKYKQMECVVKCELDPNTIKILENTFGEVKRG